MYFFFLVFIVYFVRRPHPPSASALYRVPTRLYFLLYSGCGLCTNVKFSFRCLIDGLLTNQIALLFPVRGRTEFGTMFGIKGRRFLSSPPPPPSYSPPPYFSPIFWLTPGVLLRSPAFRSLVRSPRRPKKERNRLLRRLVKSGCRMIRQVICRYASVFCILSYAVRCCRGLPNSLEKEVFHFLRSL